MHTKVIKAIKGRTLLLMSGIKNKKVMTHLTGSIFLLNQEGIRTHIR